MSEAEGSLSSSSHCSRGNGVDDSSHGESSGSGSMTNSNSTGFKDRTPEEDAIALKESKHVAYSKILVLTVLLLAATAAGVVTFIFSTKAEQTDFETQVSHSQSLRKIKCLTYESLKQFSPCCYLFFFISRL
jgi:hypothetical protein